MERPPPRLASTGARPRHGQACCSNAAWFPGPGQGDGVRSGAVRPPCGMPRWCGAASATFCPPSTAVMPSVVDRARPGPASGRICSSPSACPAAGQFGAWELVVRRRRSTRSGGAAPPLMRPTASSEPEQHGRRSLSRKAPSRTGPDVGGELGKNAKTSRDTSSVSLHARRHEHGLRQPLRNQGGMAERALQVGPRSWWTTSCGPSCPTTTGRPRSSGSRAVPPPHRTRPCRRAGWRAGQTWTDFAGCDRAAGTARRRRARAARLGA